MLSTIFDSMEGGAGAQVFHVLKGLVDLVNLSVSREPKCLSLRALLCYMISLFRETTCDYKLQNCVFSSI